MNIEGNSPAYMQNLFGENIEDMSAEDKVFTIKCKPAHDYNMPTQAHPREWFDLSTAEDVHLDAGEFKLIDLGVCIEVPEGYEAILVPRSSTFKKYNIIQTNGIGVIDNAYCGDEDWWKMPAFALDPTDIPAGTRIAQFRIQPQQMTPMCVRKVDKMDNKSRGGFGSTGN